LSRGSPLQDRQSVLRGQSSGREGTEDVTTVERQQRAQLLAMRGDSL